MISNFISLGSDQEILGFWTLHTCRWARMKREEDLPGAFSAAFPWIEFPNVRFRPFRDLRDERLENGTLIADPMENVASMITQPKQSNRKSPGVIRERDWRNRALFVCFPREQRPINRCTDTARLVTAWHLDHVHWCILKIFQSRSAVAREKALPKYYNVGPTLRVYHQILS